jgi:hypothetical protein
MIGPLGWTYLGPVENSNNDANLENGHKLCASGNPTSFNWTVGPDPKDIVGGIIAVSGISSNAPPNTSVQAREASSSTTTVSAPGLNTPQPSDEFVFASFDNYDINIIVVPPHPHSIGSSQQANTPSGGLCSGSGSDGSDRTRTEHRCCRFRFG